MAGVLIVAEASGDQLAPTTLELAGEGRRLADSLGEPLVAILAGGQAADVASRLGAYGVDRTLAAPLAGTTPPPTPWLVAAAEQAASMVQPSVVLLTHSATGRELGPLLAFHLQTSCVTDCTGLRLEGERVIFTKPVYGGSALAEMAVTTSPQVGTLRPRAFTAAAEGSSGGALETLDVPATDDRVQVLEEVREPATAGPRLKDAKIVVSGGRGIGSQENWRYVDELAQALGGAVGASRAVTDAGWVPPSHQVGLTGATIAPDLYLTVGISGAVQHIAGISGARNVVAINKDPEANIFKYARYGVVGDWKEVVPALIERLKELRG